MPISVCDHTAWLQASNRDLRADSMRILDCGGHRTVLGWISWSRLAFAEQHTCTTMCAARLAGGSSCSGAVHRALHQHRPPGAHHISATCNRLPVEHLPPWPVSNACVNQWDDRVSVSHGRTQHRRRRHGTGVWVTGYVRPRVSPSRGQRRLLGRGPSASHGGGRDQGAGKGHSRRQRRRARAGVQRPSLNFFTG